MPIKFTAQNVDKAPGPSDGKSYVIHLDTEVHGLGLRVGQTGSRNWILNYRARGLGRRLTIGSAADWPISLAREEARRLNRLIDQGHDPLAEREALLKAPSVTDLVGRWREEAAPKKRERSRQEDESLLAQWIIPELGRKLVAEVKRADIEKLHNKITKTGAPVRANRTIALLSRLFNLAIRWEMRPDNPAQRIERNPEEPRHRYLNADELVRLFAAMEKHPNRQGVDIIRLLALTGARRGEVLTMQWNDLDLQAGVWRKPAATTKQRRIHRIPLNEQAKQLLIRNKLAASGKAAANGRDLSAYVFASRHGGGPVRDIKHVWSALCRAAELTDLHLHDLRHSYASLLASSGYSLPLIGALLGHSQASTTQRYAHLLDGAQRKATEDLGTMLAALGRGTGELIDFPSGEKQAPQKPGV
jgi:integrase